MSKPQLSEVEYPEFGDPVDLTADAFADSKMLRWLLAHMDSITLSMAAGPDDVRRITIPPTRSEILRYMP
jgi:hypothetical protein